MGRAGVPHVHDERPRRSDSQHPQDNRGRSQGHQFEEKQIEQDSQDHLEEPIPDHVGYSIQSFESVGLPYEEAMVMSLETASGGIR